MGTVLFLGVALVAGICVGVLSGLLGIGGGVIMVPLFHLAFGFEAVVATATSLFCIFPTALSGAVAHVRDHTCIPAYGVVMGIGGALASPVGVWCAAQSPDIAIMAVTAVIMTYSATTMIRRALALKPADASGRDTSEGDAEERARLSRRHILISLAVGALAGFCSGYVGVGGGFIMVPLMIALLELPMSKASGTSLIAIAILAIPGIAEQLFLGNVEVLFAIAVVCGSIPGAVWGARLVKRVPERTLRFLFAGLLVVGAIVLLGNEIAALM